MNKRFLIICAILFVFVLIIVLYAVLGRQIRYNVSNTDTIRACYFSSLNQDTGLYTTEYLSIDDYSGIEDDVQSIINKVYWQTNPEDSLDSTLVGYILYTFESEKDRLNLKFICRNDDCSSNYLYISYYSSDRGYWREYFYKNKFDKQLLNLHKFFNENIH